MGAKKRRTSVVRGSENVFADLGFVDAEARLAEAERARTLRAARSLELSRATVEKLRVDPSLLLQVRARLERWDAAARARGDLGAQHVWAEWRDIMEKLSFEDLLRFVGEDTSDRATRLRQSRPFIGILSAEERDEIMRRFAAYAQVAEENRAAMATLAKQ